MQQRQPEFRTLLVAAIIKSLMSKGPCVAQEWAAKSADQWKGSALMKLYNSPLSPAGRIVLLTARHLGLELDTHQVNAAAGEHKSADYLKLNPNGLFPVLVDGDFVLWEANAIAQYLCSKVPGTRLWPQQGRAQADVTRWQFWTVAHWIPALRPYIRENFFKQLQGMGEPDAAMLAAALPQVQRFAGVLEGALKGRNWLAGDSVTLADFAVASGLMYLEPAILPLHEYAAIMRWFDGVRALPAWEETTPAQL